MLNVTIKNGNKTVAMKRHMFILDGMLRQGIDYPHSCRSGQCGRCKSKVLSGNIKHGHCDSHALNDNERAEGYFLPCRAHALSDLVIEHRAADNNIKHNVNGFVLNAEHLSESVTRLLVQPETSIAFHAGQYVHLKFNGLPARPYSMANRPDNQILEFHIRRVKGGKVSNFVFDELPIGARIDIEGPFGASCLTDAPSTPLLLVATGTGLAPIVSIARQLIQWKCDVPVQLYFGARDSADFYFLKQLNSIARQSINFQLELVQATASSSVRHGKLWEMVPAGITQPKNLLTFLAGSPTVVAQVRDGLLARGVPETAIHSDEFTYQRNEEEPVSSPVATPRKKWFSFSLFR